MNRFNTRIIVFALLILVPLYAAVFYSGLQQRAAYTVQVEDKVNDSVTLISYQEEQIVANTKEALIILSKSSDVIGGNTQRCNDFLANILATDNIYGNIGIADKDGNIFCSALYFTPGSVNIADRPFFQNAIKNSGFSNGNYQVGKITNLPGVGFGYPIYTADGNLKYVLYISLDLSWFNNYLQQFSLPEKSNAVILDSDGVVVSKSLNSPYVINDTFDLVSTDKLKQSNSSGKITTNNSAGQLIDIYYKKLNADETNPLYLLVMIQDQQLSAGLDQVMSFNIILILIAPLPTLLFVLIFGQKIIEHKKLASVKSEDVPTPKESRSK